MDFRFTSSHTPAGFTMRKRLDRKGKICSHTPASCTIEERVKEWVRVKITTHKQRRSLNFQTLPFLHVIHSQYSTQYNTAKGPVLLPQLTVDRQLPDLPIPTLSVFHSINILLRTSSIASFWLSSHFHSCNEASACVTYIIHS
jgi:hypothetical protein